MSTIALIIHFSYVLQYVEETIFFQGFPKEHRFEEKLERRALLLPVPICQDPKKGVRGGEREKFACVVFSCSWKFYVLTVVTIIFRIPMQNVSFYLFSGFFDKKLG